jgi:hypothetical protein
MSALRKPIRERVYQLPMPPIAPPAHRLAELRAWNEAVPAGTWGTLTMVDARGRRTTIRAQTRSRAQLRSDGTIVVWFWDLRGCHDVCRFRPGSA